MGFGKLVSLISTFLLLCTFALAQADSAAADPEKEKKKKEMDEKVVEMLDQAIADAQALRLSQNRAIVYALAGDLYWKFDEKRSRDLFRSAANEILAYNAETEKEKRDSTDSFVQLPDPNDPRNQVMPLVAKTQTHFAGSISLTLPRSSSLLL